MNLNSQGSCVEDTEVCVRYCSIIQMKTCTIFPDYLQWNNFCVQKPIHITCADQTILFSFLLDFTPSTKIKQFTQLNEVLCFICQFLVKSNSYMYQRFRFCALLWHFNFDIVFLHWLSKEGAWIFHFGYWDPYVLPNWGPFHFWWVPIFSAPSQKKKFTKKTSGK